MASCGGVANGETTQPRTRVFKMQPARGFFLLFFWRVANADAAAAVRVVCDPSAAVCGIEAVTSCVRLASVSETVIYLF